MTRTRRVAPALLTLLLAAPAGGSEPPAQQRIAVVGFGRCEDAVLSGGVRRLRDEMAARAPGRVLSEDAAAAPGGGIARSSVAEAQRALDSAKADLAALEAGRAERTLRGLLPALAAFPPGRSRWELSCAARAHLARVLQHQGEKGQAVELFLQVLKVQEDFSLDPLEYPPSTRELLDLARTALAGLPRFRLTVPGQRPGQTVHLDGFPAGVTPFERSLAGGRYEVVVSDPSGRSFSRTLVVSSELRLEADVSREGLLRPNAGPCVQGDAGRDARLEYASLLGGAIPAEALVAVRLERIGGEDYLAAALVEPALGREVREGRVRLENGALPALDRLALFVLTGEGGPPAPAADTSSAGQAAVAPNEPMTLLPPPPPALQTSAPVPAEVGGPGWKRVTGWAASAVAVGLAAGAGYEHWRLSNLEDELADLVVGGTAGAVRPEDVEKSQALKRDISSAQSFRNRFAVGAGLAAVGAAGLLLWDALGGPAVPVTILPSAGGAAVAGALSF